MIKEKFIHFLKYETLLTKKLSADINNTTYTYGLKPEVYEGEPDVSYQSIVFVKDRKVIYTHGQLYDASGEADKLKNSVTINGTEFDGSTDIVTEKWGSPITVTIADNSKKHTGGVHTVDGSNDIVLRLPKVIEANVTNDSEGNNIASTYTTKKELNSVVDELPTFFVYSGDDDTDPTLDSLPASSWDTQELRNTHAGDYYVTSTGRLFKFYEDPKTGWEWKEITNYYLYDCLESLRNIEGRLDLFVSWDETQTTPERGTIQIKGIDQSNRAYLDVVCCNQYVSYNVEEDIDLYLPFIYGPYWVRTRTKYLSRESHLITLRDIAKVLGKTIIIVNESTSTSNINLKLGDGPNGTNITKTILPGKSCTIRLNMSEISGYVCYYWELIQENVSFSVNWE